MGRYLLGPELGRGGMGRVHEAWDPFLGRLVALKILHGNDPIHLVRLLREAQSQARLRHSGICQILDAETDAAQGLSFIAMEHVCGRPLSDLKGRLSHREVVAVVADVAGAMQAAHEAGLVHRDLKPANILVQEEGDGHLRPVVVDFGLARDLVGSDQTLSWALAGTPAFMSPQQGRGEPPSPQDDVYALGATLYVMLTGTMPFEAATLVGLLTQQATRDPRPLRRQHREVPRDLETICLKAVETVAARRYATAGALEADLRRFLEGRPIQARPIHWPERSWRMMARHRALATTAAAALIAVAGLVAWNLHAREQQREQVALAQRFGMEVQELENLLRVERMMPPHDMHPAEGRVRQRLEALARRMQTLGSVAEGPGYAALGQGYLALRDIPAALKALQKAWDRGYRTPEVAEALGSAHWETYAGAFPPLQYDASPEAQAKIQDLRNRHHDPAKALLRQVVDPQGASLAAARLAMLENRYRDVRAECQKVFARHPWRYEVLLLECRAFREEIREHAWDGWDPERLRPLYQELEALLDRIGAMARSDVKVFEERLYALNAQVTRESEGGHPTLEPFVRARTLFEEALRIAPDDPGLSEARSNTLHREAFLRLARGEDVRPFLAEGLRWLEVARSRTGDEPWIRRSEEVFLWLKGEAEWRQGIDPRATFQAALAIAASGWDRAEILNALGRDQGQRGVDPRGSWAEAERILETDERKQPDDFYVCTIWGELCLNRVRWQMQLGRDPSASLAEGLRRLRQAVQIKPSSAYAFWHLAQLQALAARQQLAHGGDPSAAIEEAQDAARRAIALRQDHFRSHLGLAEAWLAQAEFDRARGWNASKALEAARRAGAAARACNPTDWRIAWTQGRVELEASRMAGRAARACLDRAVAFADAGLKVKTDAPELWLLRAQALPQGRGQIDAQKALALQPGLKEAQALMVRPPSAP